MSTPYVLYRDSVTTPTELDSIRKSGITHGVDLPEGLEKDTIVFPRFRTIPYGQMLEEQVLGLGGVLVNTWEQYKYISDVNAWADHLKGLTPAVYSEADIPGLPEGEWFVKGETNSDKENWGTACYAPDLASLGQVVENLHGHPVVGSQKLIIRPYIHYTTLGAMSNGQPICNEWRAFVLNGQVVGLGFYWFGQKDNIEFQPSNPSSNPEFQTTLQEAVKRINGRASYVVIDFAERVDGTWDVIELNDANMSGLCGVDPDTLWSNIRSCFV